MTAVVGQCRWARPSFSIVEWHPDLQAGELVRPLADSRLSLGSRNFPPDAKPRVLLTHRAQPSSDLNSQRCLVVSQVSENEWPRLLAASCELCPVARLATRLAKRFGCAPALSGVRSAAEAVCLAQMFCSSATVLYSANWKLQTMAGFLATLPELALPPCAALSQRVHAGTPAAVL